MHAFARICILVPEYRAAEASTMRICVGNYLIYITLFPQIKGLVIVNIPPFSPGSGDA